MNEPVNTLQVNTRTRAKMTARWRPATSRQVGLTLCWHIGAMLPRASNGARRGGLIGRPARPQFEWHALPPAALPAQQPRWNNRQKPLHK